jgi:hypothetical protein
MAKRVKDDVQFGFKMHSKSKQKRTSVGKASRKTKPRNKKKRINWKKYRGQGGRN